MSRSSNQRRASIIQGESEAGNFFKESYPNYNAKDADLDDALAKAIVGQDFALQSMARQNEYNIAAEERANAYNDIGAQIERAERAGVNPLVALGVSAEQGISSVSGLTSGQPSGPAPSETFRNSIQSAQGIVSGLSDLTNMGLDVYEGISGVRLVNEQIHDLQSQQRLREYEISEKAFQARMQPIREDILRNSKNKSQAEARLAQLDADIQSLWLVPDDKGAIPARQKVLATVSNMQKEGILTHAQASAYLAQAGLADEQTRTQKHRTTLAQKQADNYETTVVEPAKAETTAKNAQAGLFESQQTRQDFENFYLRHTGSKPGDGFEATLAGAIRGLVSNYAENGIEMPKFIQELKAYADNFDSTVQSYIEAFADYLSSLSPQDASDILNSNNSSGVVVHKGRVMAPYRSVYR